MNLRRVRKLVGKITKIHCADCEYRINGNRCRRLGVIGYCCRNGIFPIGFKRK